MPRRDRAGEGRDRSVHGFVRFAVAVAVVGVGSAVFSASFRALLAGVYTGIFHAPTVVDAMTRLPLPLRVLVPLAGGLAAGVVTRLRGRLRQDVSNVMEAVVLGNVRLSLRTTLGRVSSSWLAIASGLSIGREGPLIEFGGALGVAVGRVSRLSMRRTRILVAAGTAAGFAAAYNTPFAAALFVIETVIGIAALEAVIPTIAATVVASMVTRSIVGGGPIYGARAFSTTSPWEFGSFLVIALAGAGAATVFKRALGWFESAFEQAALRQPWRSALGGLLVGVVVAGIPQVAGNGYEPLNLLLDRPATASFLIVLLVAKMAATSASVACGIPGGIFTPLLLTGGIVGALWGHVAANFWTTTPADIGSYVLLGMAATTAASIHAPLTAAVLVFELSGDYAIVLPLLFVTATSTAVSRWLGAVSVYEAELWRRGLRWQLTLEGREMTPPAPDAAARAE